MAVKNPGLETTINTYNEYATTGAGKDLTNAQFVQDAYAKLLNLSGAFDNAQARMDYWIAKLEAGTLTKATFADTFLYEAKNFQGTLVTAQGFANNQAAVAKIAANDTYNTSIAAIEAVYSGKTFTLTTGVDTLSPTSADPAKKTTAGNDTINAVIDNVTSSTNVDTLTPLDNIDGGAGKDTLNISIVKNGATGTAAFTALPSVTIANIETMNIQSSVVVGATGAASAFDTTTIAGLEKLNITKSAGAFVKAAATTDVSVAGTTGAIEVYNAKDVTVTNATANKAITIGDGVATEGNPAGTITVTDTDNSGANAIKVYGGTDVTVTASTKATPTGDIVVGDATKGTATGNVVVTQNLNSDGVVAAIAADAIAVTGGKTVTVTQNANSTAKAFDSNNGITTSTVVVTADDKTTDVTVKAIANITNVTRDAVDEVKGTTAVTFKDVAAGDIVTVNGLVFTAAKNLTAAEVAQAFANLTATETQSTGGVVGNGIYTGALTGTLKSGAANGATVVFTNTAAAGTAAPTMTITATDSSTAAKASALPTEAPTTGTAAVTYAKSTNGVVYNTVVIDENSDTKQSIENVTVNGATTVTLGTSGTSTKSLDAIKTVSLTNVTTAANLSSTATSLDLTLNKVAGTVNLDVDGATITDLTIKTTGEKSTISTLTAAAVKNATIDAGAELVINAVGAAGANALETVTVKGAAAVTLGTVAASTSLKSFDASANTGGVTATIDAATAGSHADLKTFTFSGGNDVVTLNNVTVDKKIDLGAGDDKITLATSSTGITAAIKGGTDTDTIAMDAATAATLLVGAPAAANFTEKVTGFERLELTTATAANTALTIDLAAIGGYNYVTTKGTGASTTATTAITLNNMANNGTVVLTAANGAVATGSTGIVVNVKDADTVDSTLNTVISSSTNLDAGLLTAQNVKTVNINIVDTEAAPQTINSNDLILTANAATTVKVTGTANLDLDLTGSTKVTLVDASELKGGLTATTLISTAATTIKGGSGIDKLTATSNNDVLIGGAGNDILTVTSGNLVQLHGGEGKDTYVIGATAEKAAFATITGTAAELSGDVIKFGAATIAAFTTEKLVLDADVASFNNYVDLASKTGTDNTVSYFEWAGNTYLVHDTDASIVTFKAGADAIVKIAGIVDFTFNNSGVLEIA